MLLSILLCLLVADFVSGLFHWAEDTWLVPSRNAWIDRYIVEPNIEHHRNPGRMRENTYLDTNAVTLVLTIAAAVICLLAGVHAWQAYVTLAIVSHSNQYHQWAHRQDVPLAVRVLQEMGLLQSVAHHGEHHRSPYAMRYCTTTNFLNPILDRLRLWRALEWACERCGLRVARATPMRFGY